MTMVRGFAFLCVFFCLSGCSWLGLSADDAKKEDKTEKEEPQVTSKKKTPICPQVAIVRDLEYMKDYGSEKPSPDQLVAEALLKSVAGDCGYEKNGVDISFQLDLAAMRGPRLGGNRTSFPFFVAIVKPDQTILSKELMTATFTFASDSKIADYTENLHVVIPLAKATQPSESSDEYDVSAGPQYQVLIGFQHPPDGSR
jgi:hypothetical protein